MAPCAKRSSNERTERVGEPEAGAGGIFPTFTWMRNIYWMVPKECIPIHKNLLDNVSLGLGEASHDPGPVAIGSSADHIDLKLRPLPNTERSGVD